MLMSLRCAYHVVLAELVLRVASHADAEDQQLAVARGVSVFFDRTCVAKTSQRRSSAGVVRERREDVQRRAVGRGVSTLYVEL